MRVWDQRFCQKEQAAGCCRPPPVISTIDIVICQHSKLSWVEPRCIPLLLVHGQASKRFLSQACYRSWIWFDEHTDESPTIEHFSCWSFDRSLIRFISLEYILLLYHQTEKIHDWTGMDLEWIIRIQKRWYWCLPTVVVQLHTASK